MGTFISSLSKYVDAALEYPQQKRFYFSKNLLISWLNLRFRASRAFKILRTILQTFLSFKKSKS